MNEKKSESTIRVSKTMLHPLDAICSGVELQSLIDVAFIAAMRSERKRIVMESIDKISFLKSISDDVIVELVGRVIDVGSSSIKVKVEMYSEQIFTGARDLVISGTFNFIEIADEKSHRVSMMNYQRVDTDVFVGGEIELRKELNTRLFPKTVARATLYNYLEQLGIRKTLYTQNDVIIVVDYIRSLKVEKRKSV